MPVAYSDIVDIFEENFVSFQQMCFLTWHYLHHVNSALCEATNHC